MLVGLLGSRSAEAAPFGAGLPARAVLTQSTRPAASAGFSIITTRATLDGIAVEPPAQALVESGTVRLEAPRTVTRTDERPIRISASAARGAVRAPSTAPTELQWRRFGTTLRRVWQITDSSAHWSVDAASGRILARHDHPSAPLGSAYPRSPVVDDVPTMLELPTLEDGAANLASSDLVVDSCEAPTGGSWPGFSGRCNLVERAVPDAEGNFVAEPELDVFAFDDAFAETSAYAHAGRVLDTFADHGVPTLRCPDQFGEPTHFVVNYWLEGVAPYSNGNYLGFCDPAIVIGQGSDADGAYDADLIAHELGHALVHTVAGHLLYGVHTHPHGVTSDPKAINEGFADFIAAVHVDDSELIFFGVDGRTLEHDRTCPDDLVGQQHHDGRPFAALLWDFYLAFGDPAVPVVFDAIALLEPGAGFDQAGATLREVTSVELGAEAAAWLDEALAERGLEGCDRVLPYTEELVVLLAPIHGFATFVPGPLQVRVDPPPEAISATLVIAGIAPSGEPAPISVLTRSGEPVAFEYGDDAPRSVTAHFDTAHEALEFPNVAIDVPVSDGTPLYVAFAQTGEEAIYGGLASVVFELADPSEDESGDGGATTDGTGGDDGTGGGTTTRDPDEGETGDTAPAGDEDGAAPGCSCTTGSDGRRWPALAMLLLFACRRRAGKATEPVRRCRPRWGHRRIAGPG